MTGLVKEEILTRLGELGVVVEDGVLAFEPVMLRAGGFMDAPTQFSYVDLEGEARVLDLPAGVLAFTYCQVPVVYVAGGEAGIEVHTTDGGVERVEGSALSREVSASIFKREGRVERLVVHVGAGGDSPR